MMMRVLKLGASVAVLGMLIWWADTGTIMDRLRNADLIWLGITLVTLTVLTLLMARRWQIVAKAFGIELPFSRALSEYYITQFINAVLPGGVLGDIGRAVRIRREGDLVRAAQSVVAERMMGQVTLFVLMGVGFVCALLVPGGVDWPAIAWVGILALICACLAAIALVRTDNSIGRFLRLILDLMQQTRLLVYSLIIAALLIFSFYACARATGTVIAMRDLFTVIPLILSAMLVPLSVGGWGWREGAAAALYPLIGASAGAGIAAGIAYGAMITLAAFPAVLFWATAQCSKSLPRHTRLDAP